MKKYLSVFPVGRGRQRKPNFTWPLTVLYKSEQLTSTHCLNKDMQQKWNTACHWHLLQHFQMVRNTMFRPQPVRCFWPHVSSLTNHWFKLPHIKFFQYVLMNQSTWYNCSSQAQYIYLSPSYVSPSELLALGKLTSVGARDGKSLLTWQLSMNVDL